MVEKGKGQKALEGENSGSSFRGKIPVPAVSMSDRKTGKLGDMEAREEDNMVSVQENAKPSRKNGKRDPRLSEG